MDWDWKVEITRAPAQRWIVLPTHSGGHPLDGRRSLASAAVGELVLVPDGRHEVVLRLMHRDSWAIPPLYGPKLGKVIWNGLDLRGLLLRGMAGASAHRATHPDWIQGWWLRRARPGDVGALGWAKHYPFDAKTIAERVLVESSG